MLLFESTLVPMENGNADRHIQDAIEEVFRSHEDILYIAVINDKLAVTSHQGLLDLHPSKLHILHVQAALLVNMSSVWSESLGTLDFVSASFDSKFEIVVMAIASKMHLIAVLSHVSGRGTENTRSEIVKRFKSIQVNSR